MINLNKHFLRIRRGGVLVIIKKIRFLFYFFLTFPIYIFAIPMVIVMRLIRPFFLVRWKELNSSRIGHFAADVEIYCCERDAKINIPSQRYVDLFYLKKYISNVQLAKMWRRSIIILPTWLLFPLFIVNRFFNIFVPGGHYHEVNYQGLSVKQLNIEGISSPSVHDDRDIYNLLGKTQPHLSFTQNEEIKGKEILKKFGVPIDAKFVCLAVRDSAYLDMHKKETYSRRDWSYHKYRDGNIEDFVLAAEELVNRGYYIFRMGVKVLRPLKSSNPKIIDYANSGMRSEFTDVYLCAKCTFFISAESGLEKVPVIFRKPTVCRQMPLAYIFTGYQKDLIIVKHHINKKNKKKMTMSEIFLSNTAMALTAAEFKKNEVELEENSSEEIKDVAIEMDERLKGNWKETEEDVSRQKKFWFTFEENMKKLNLQLPLHGEIKSKFGSKFLSDNQNWIK